MANKRPYRLGEREATMADTRQRIVDAAAASYVELGIAGTSVREVARRAQVAPGTVLNHFPDPDELVRAAIAKWTEELRLPEADDIDPEAPLGERVHAFLGGVMAFYDRTQWIGNSKLIQNSSEHPVLAAAIAEWESGLGQMLFRTLGEHATSPENVRILATFTHPWLFEVFVGSGFSAERAAEITSTMVTHWLEHPRGDGPT